MPSYANALQFLLPVPSQFCLPSYKILMPTSLCSMLRCACSLQTSRAPVMSRYLFVQADEMKIKAAFKSPVANTTAMSEVSVTCGRHSISAKREQGV